MRHIAIAVCTVLDSWWWTEKLSKTCRALFQKSVWEISASRWFYYKNKSSVLKWMALYLQIYILSIVKMWDMARSICQCYFDTSSWFSEMNVLYAKELLLLLLLLLSHWHVRVISHHLLPCSTYSLSNEFDSDHHLG